MISTDTFEDVDIRVGTIETAERIEGTDKLLRLSVDLGEETPRQIVSGVAPFFRSGADLVGKQCLFVVNLKPRKIRGYESAGMILAVGGERAEDPFALVVPDRAVPPGTRVH